mgnify:CR=1 FL=1
MRNDGPIVLQKELKPSGWTTQPKKKRYICFLPHQLLEYIRDAFPACALPKDAIFDGTFESDAREHTLLLNFFSTKEPMVNALLLRENEIHSIFKQMLGKYLPTDFEVSGLLVSGLWAWVKLEVRSERFKDVLQGKEPNIDVRYEGGELKIYDQTQPNFVRDGMLTEAIL